MSRSHRKGTTMIETSDIGINLRGFSVNGIKGNIELNGDLIKCLKIMVNIFENFAEMDVDLNLDDGEKR